MVSSLKIGSVMGIPIKLHLTFLLILPFIAFAFATSPPPLGFSNVPDIWIRIGLSLIGGGPALRLRAHPRAGALVHRRA